jgi:hypothetical protein
MIGTLIRARMIPPLSTFTPTGAPVYWVMSRLITVKPIKPHTTLGMAASSSMTIFKVSLSLGPQNSDTKIAAPRPKGTAIAMASTVTLKVPTVSASVP